MKFLRTNKAKNQYLGLECSANELNVALCGLSSDRTSVHQLKALKAFSDFSSEKERVQALNAWVGEHRLKGLPCNVSLKAGQYQLLLLEAPDVPEQEMRAAIRWKVKELSSVPLEEAAIDIFMLPKDGVRAGKDMVYVVVSELKLMKTIIHLIKEAELRLSTIDIAELALRNLALLKQDEQSQSRGVGIVHMGVGSATVYLYRMGNLYLSRQFNLDYGGGLLEEIPEDSFLLEVQRSLDYYERQMGQTPPVALYICGENISDDKVTKSIGRGLSVPAKFFDLKTTFNLADVEEFDPALLQHCSVALGAALRDRVALL